jgi:hypothetical protein
MRTTIWLSALFVFTALYTLVPEPVTAQQTPSKKGAATKLEIPWRFPMPPRSLDQVHLLEIDSPIIIGDSSTHIAHLSGFQMLAGGDVVIQDSNFQVIGFEVLNPAYTKDLTGASNWTITLPNTATLKWTNGDGQKIHIDTKGKPYNIVINSDNMPDLVFPNDHFTSVKLAVNNQMVYPSGGTVFPPSGLQVRIHYCHNGRCN